MQGMFTAGRCSQMTPQECLRRRLLHETRRSKDQEDASSARAVGVSCICSLLSYRVERVKHCFKFWILDALEH